MDGNSFIRFYIIIIGLEKNIFTKFFYINNTLKGMENVL